MVQDYGYLILSGGKGLRMNRKNKLTLEVNGISQIERLKRLIGSTESSLGKDEQVSGREVFLSCTKRERMTESDKELYDSADLPLIEDIIEDCGPVGGIFSALSLSKKDALIVLSSDLYTKSGNALLPLIKSFLETGRPVFYSNESGIISPIPGIYTKDMLHDMSSSLEKGELSLCRVIREYSRKKAIELIRCTESGIFRNLNTLSDVVEAEKSEKAECRSDHTAGRSLGLEEAFDRLKNAFDVEKTEMKAEAVELWDAAGRYIAEDVSAPIAQPPFDRSPLDGYALRSEDIAAASQDAPAVLKVIDKAYAGDTRRLCIGKGEAIRIMTGAPLPSGADTVVMQEQTDCGEGKPDENGGYISGNVRIFTSSEAGKNIVYAGEDFTEGKLLLRKGEQLEAAGVALLASAGLMRLKVSPKIRISVFSTGDELTSPGGSLEYGKIYDSNLYGAVALFKLCNENVVRAEHLKDDAGLIAEKIKTALEDSDIVITTGGVSVGQKDVMPEVLELIKAETVFHRLDLKPGMPTRCAKCGGKAIFCLSGNPAAAYTHMELIIKPFLRYLHGACDGEPWERKNAILLQDIKKKSPKRRLLRGFFENGAVSFPEGCFSSGSLCGLERSNCFIDIPGGSPPLSKGSIVDILSFDSLNRPVRSNRYSSDSSCGAKEIYNERKKPLIYAVSGYKNTGKTRLINALIPRLSEMGLRVACIKHDGHDFEPDVPGTDSRSFRDSGAIGCAVFSAGRFMLTRETACDERLLMSAFPDADIILIEGLKNSKYPKHICNYPEEEADIDGVLREIMKLYKGSGVNA